MGIPEIKNLDVTTNIRFENGSQKFKSDVLYDLVLKQFEHDMKDDENTLISKADRMYNAMVRSGIIREL